MDSLPLFYKKPVPLNKDQHGDLYMEPVNDFKHTIGTNSVYIAAVEFIKSAKDYPIVFGRNSDGSVFPAVLLGIQNSQNRFIGKQGEWLVDYIPAYVRRYPFILASNPGSSDTFAVCIDESYRGFNRKKKGQRLFEESGEESDILKQSIEFLRGYQNQIHITNVFCKNLKDSGILDPMQAKITKDGKERALGGFLCVNRERLKGLEPKKLAEFMMSDQLELIFAHLYSLNNLNKLVNSE